MIAQYNLTQENANSLIDLMNDLLFSEEQVERFDQELCSCCVIGGALRRGVIDDKGGYYSEERYTEAIFVLDLPRPSQRFRNDNIWSRNAVEGYLFGSGAEIADRAEDLNFPLFGSSNNQDDAWNRIKTVLENGGYEVKF